MAEAMNPAALTVAQAAKVLTALGKPVTVEMLSRDIEDGAPTNPDGTLNLVNYAAWIVQEFGHGN